jgi:hypothetical protein
LRDPQSISVLDAHIPAGDRTFPRSHYVAYADIFPQDLAAPAVVVPSHPQNIHSCVAQLRECRERAKASPWNYCFPLEPEIEQVAVDHKRARFSSQSAKERDERALDLRAGHAQVRVRYDIAGGVEHGSS